MQAFCRFHCAIDKTVCCGYVLRIEHIYRGCIFRTIRRSKYYEEIYIVESIIVKLFIMFTYTIRFWWENSIFVKPVKTVKIQFCDFGEKTQYSILAKKLIFLMFWRKNSIFFVLTRKMSFDFFHLYLYDHILSC